MLSLLLYNWIQWCFLVHILLFAVISLVAAAAAAKSLQSCPTLCNPIDGSPSGSAVLGILQARTLEWVAISFSNAGKWKVKVKSLSHVQLSATPWTAAYQAPPSMGFSRQEYWSGVPLPSPLGTSNFLMPSLFLGFVTAFSSDIPPTSLAPLFSFSPLAISSSGSSLLF